MEAVFGDTGIKQKVIDEIRQIAELYDVDKVVLFGSRSRGNYRERSDIDIAFSGGSASRFSLDIDEDTSTLLEFDIVDLCRYVSPELRESIEREGITIYEKV